MSIVDTSKLVEARTVFSKAFDRGLQGKREGQTRVRTLLANEVTSTGKQNKYPIVGGLQRFREFIGERVYQQLSRYAYTLVNRTFDNSVEVGIDDFEDEQYEGYTTLFQMLGEQGDELPEDLLVDALKGGELATSLSYDEVPFFSASHRLEPAVASTAYPNLFTGAPLNEANFDIVYNSMSSIPTRDGRFVPWGKDIVLAVPPQLETTGKKIVAASQNASGATNVLEGKARVVKLQDLGTAPTEWYLADVGSVLKPLLLQMRKPVKMNPPKGTEDYILLERVLRWIGEGRMAAGYQAPFLIAKAKP